MYFFNNNLGILKIVKKVQCMCCDLFMYMHMYIMDHSSKKREELRRKKLQELVKKEVEFPGVINKKSWKFHVCSTIFWNFQGDALLFLEFQR